eukprot:13939672-Alexandrium_andersonii.AAC.1
MLATWPSPEASRRPPRPIESSPWLRLAQAARIARIVDWRIADCSPQIRDFATSDPLEARF